MSQPQPTLSVKASGVGKKNEAGTSAVLCSPASRETNFLKNSLFDSFRAVVMLPCDVTDFFYLNSSDTFKCSTHPFRRRPFSPGARQISAVNARVQIKTTNPIPDSRHTAGCRKNGRRRGATQSGGGETSRRCCSSSIN